MFKKFNIVVVSLVVLVSLSGCFGPPKPWVDAGFKDNRDFNCDLDSFVSSGNMVRLPTWECWEKNGFSASEAKEWNDFKSIESSKDWKRNGFTAVEAKKWNRVVGYADASKFKSLGLKVEDLDSGHYPKYIKWIENGLTHSDVVTWNLYFMDIDWESVLKFKKYNISFKTYKNWYEVNNGFISANDIKYFQDNNISTDKYKELYDILLSVWNSKAWAKTRLNNKVVENFRVLSRSIVEDKKKLDRVLKYCNRIEDTGLYSAVELSKISPFSTQGKCYKYLGKVTSIQDRKLVEIEECINTSNTFDNCMDGRVSLMKFENGIPDSLTVGSVYKGIVLSSGHIKEYLYGNSDKNTDMIFPIIEE